MSAARAVRLQDGLRPNGSEAVEGHAPESCGTLTVVEEGDGDGNGDGDGDRRRDRINVVLLALVALAFLGAAFAGARQ